MATTGSINGTDIGLYVDGTLIACATAHTLERTMDTRETTCKDSAGWKQLAEATRSWTVSGDFNVIGGTSYGIEDLHALWVNRTMVQVKFSTTESGDKYYKGNAYITSISESAAMEDTVTFSASFEGSGALTEATLT